MKNDKNINIYILSLQSRFNNTLKVTIIKNNIKIMENKLTLLSSE